MAWDKMARTIRDLMLSVLVAFGIAVFVARRLDVDVATSLKTLSGLSTERDLEEKFARIGRGPDVNAMYNFLAPLSIPQLYRIRATDNLCQTVSIDCRGVSRNGVLSLIEGIIRQKDDANTQKSYTVSIAALAASVFSAAISFLAYLKKK